jgi:hypothetical protein
MAIVPGTEIDVYAVETVEPDLYRATKNGSPLGASASSLQVAITAVFDHTKDDFPEEASAMLASFAGQVSGPPQFKVPELPKYALATARSLCRAAVMMNDEEAEEEMAAWLRSLGLMGEGPSELDDDALAEAVKAAKAELAKRMSCG